MRKSAIGVVVLLLGASVSSASAQEGTGAEFALGGGVTVPTGDFDDAAKLGWHGTAAVSFVPPNLPVGFQIDGTFSRLSDESPADVQAQMIYGTANVVYKFKSSPDTRFRPYLIGGGGVYNLDEKGDDALPGDSQTKFGINAGAGFDFKAGAAGLFIEGRFHDVFTDGSNVQFIPITLGVRFGGN